MKINMKTEQELNEKIKDLKESFDPILKPSMNDMQKWFKKEYNDIFYEGRKCLINLRTFFNGPNGSLWRKRFNNEPIQPVTITYRRCDLVFFTYDKYPTYKEEYFIHDGNSTWTRNFYPREIKASELFKNKMYLLKENPNELYLQVNVLTIGDLYGWITYENDLTYDIIRKLRNENDKTTGSI